MPKNFQIHLRIETKVIDQLKKQASDENLSFGEVCRQKLRQNSKLEKIETEISDIKNILTTQLNLNRRCKMVNKLPQYKGYTIDERLRQIRKVDPKKPSIEFIDFDSEEGQEILDEYYDTESLEE